MLKPLVQFDVRPDLALELGILELARTPMSETEYASQMARHGQRKQGLLRTIWPDYAAYVAAVARYALPSEVALFCQIEVGEVDACAIISDGQHHFRIAGDGLFESVLQQARHALDHEGVGVGAEGENPFSPEPLSEPASSIIAPQCFVIAYSGKRKASVMPGRSWKRFVSTRPFLTILHPKDLSAAHDD